MIATSQLASIQRAGSTAQVSTFERRGEKVKIPNLGHAIAMVSCQVDQSLLILKQRERAKVHAPSSRTKSRFPISLIPSLLARPCGDYRQ